MRAPIFVPVDFLRGQAPVKKDNCDQPSQASPDKESRDCGAFRGIKVKLRKLVLLPAAAAAIAFGTPAIANSLTFQNVTFETQALDADTLRLSILNATNATGDWTGVDFLKAFEIKAIGDPTFASVVSGPGSWTATVDSGLSANLGCTTGGTNGGCFSATSPVALTDSMIWTIDFAGTNLSFDSPSLKVQFLTGANATSKTGSLLSQTIPAVTPIPEPETYAMMLAGLGLLGFVARRRRQSFGYALSS